MSYNPKLIQQEVASTLQDDPSTTLRRLSQRLCIGERTIEKAIILSTGVCFRRFRDQTILTVVDHFFASRPELAIKEVCFILGFKSASSFARTIKRVSGLSPLQLRNRYVRQLSERQKVIPV